MGILNPHHEPVHNVYTRTSYNWKFHTHQVEYNNCVSELLDSSEFDFTDVNRTFDTVVDCITAASEANIPKRQFKPHLKPYWPQELKLLHIQMRRDRRCWTNDGKPRANADSYNRYKKSKCEFRRLLRLKFRQFEKEENERIDNLVEVDQKAFWKVVNSRRKTKRSTTGSEIKFGSNPLKDPDDIKEGWCANFTNLYRFTEDSSFDECFREVVDKEINRILSSDNTDYQQFLVY